MLQLGEAFVEQCMGHLSWLADTHMYEHPARKCYDQMRGQQEEQKMSQHFVSVLKSIS